MHLRERAELAELMAAQLHCNERTRQTLSGLIESLTEIVRQVRHVNNQLDAIGMTNRTERTLLAGVEMILDDAAEQAMEAGQCLN